MRSRLAHPSWKIAVAAAAVMVAHACQDVSVTAVDVASLTLLPEEGSLLPGDTLRLTVELRDAAGHVLHARPVVWSSENSQVAQVDEAGMVVGRSAGETRVRASSGGAEGTASIIVKEPPRLELSHSEIRFEAASGEGPTSSRTVEITSGGGDPVAGLTLSVSYASGQPSGWLNASLQGASTPTAVTLRASAQSLGAGEYEAEVRIDSPTLQERRTIRVVFEVEAVPARIRLSTSSVTVEAQAGGSSPSARTVEVTNSGGGQLSGLEASTEYASGSSGWLSAQLESSTAPTSLRLSFDIGGLSEGRHEATVRVSAAGAANSPQTVAVRLDVTSAPAAPPPSTPSPSAVHSTITASAEEIPADGTSTSTITVQLRGSNGDPAPMDDAPELRTTAGTLSSVTNHGQGRYTATLTSGTSPATAVVSGRIYAGLVIADSATVRFVAPPNSSVSVSEISYSTAGGPAGDRHLRVNVQVSSEGDTPVSNADVTGVIRNRETNETWDRSGKSGGDGVAVLSLSNHEKGCYVTTITHLDAPGRAWDGETPENGACTK